MVSSAKILGLSRDGNDIRSARELVLSHVRQRPDGTTLLDTAEAVDIPKHRVKQILIELDHDREIYSRKIRGVSGPMYYPNGRLIHKYLQRSKELGTQIFRISFHEGRTGPRVQIQERTFTLMEGEKVEGSIFIDHDSLDSFIEFIVEMNSDFGSFKR